MIVTVSPEGQVTLPEDVVRHLGAGPGDKVTVENLPGGRISLSAFKPTPSYAAKGFEALSGCLHRPGMKALSIEEINEAAAAGWAGEVDFDR